MITDCSVSITAFDVLLRRSAFNIWRVASAFGVRRLAFDVLHALVVSSRCTEVGIYYVRNLLRGAVGRTSGAKSNAYSGTPAAARSFSLKGIKTKSMLIRSVKKQMAMCQTP